MFQFSRRLALVFGVALPVVETIRRFRNSVTSAIGRCGSTICCSGPRCCWRAHDSSRPRYQNARYLAAAWGAACGMGYYSFITQLSASTWRIPHPFPRRGSQPSKAWGYALPSWR